MTTHGIFLDPVQVEGIATTKVSETTVQANLILVNNLFLFFIHKRFWNYVRKSKTGLLTAANYIGIEDKTNWFHTRSSNGKKLTVIIR